MRVEAGVGAGSEVERKTRCCVEEEDGMEKREM